VSWGARRTRGGWLTITVTAVVLDAKDGRVQAGAFFGGRDAVFRHGAALGKRSVQITVRTGDHVEECTRN
jgi:hypothetical protein